MTQNTALQQALVVIDVQNDYFPGGRWTLAGMEAAADNVARLLTAARTAGDTVIHVRHEFPTSDAPFFVPGSVGAEIHAKAHNVGREPVVVKNQINAFRDTALKQLLDQAGIQDVVLCGAMSHMCVDAAVRAASDFGYRCTVIHDACATRDQEFQGLKVPAEQVHAAYMSALGFGYATLLSTKDFVANSTAK